MMLDLGLPIGADTRLVVIRSRHQPIRNFPCVRCAASRQVKRTRHFQRRRIDRADGSEQRFWECWCCGHRIF